MKRICLFTSPFPFMQPINQGIADCSRRIGPWRVEMQYADLGDIDLPQLRSRYDGVIVTYLAGFWRALAESGVTVVSALADNSGLSYVTVDDVAIGLAGARHLIECGYRRFAFYGYGTPWSEARRVGFAQGVHSAGLELLDVGESAATVARSDGTDDLAPYLRFLARLRPPVAVMACHDAAARVIADCAVEQGLRVPGDLAVLGVDNDELLCETGACPLSSVDPNLHRVGYDAALLLDRTMRDPSAEVSVSRVPPRGVVRRQSTSLFAHDDPDIAAALRIIHQRACDGLTVADVCRQIALSRRRFEQRFVAAVGRPPGDEIRRQRMDRAKGLLTETDMTLAEVSVRCGYQFVSGFSTAFRKVVGVSPGEYRRRAVP